MRDQNYYSQQQKMSKGKESPLEIVAFALAFGMLAVGSLLLALVWGA